MNNKKETKRLLINTALIAFGNLGAKLISFLLLPLYTSILTTSDYGIYDFIITISTFLTPVVSLSLYESLFRFLIEAKQKDDNKKVKNVISCSIILTIICEIIYFVISIIIFWISKINYIPILTLYVISGILYLFSISLLRGIGQLKFYALYSGIKNALQVLLSYISVAKLNLGINGLLFATIITSFGISIAIFIHFKLWEYISIRKENFKMAKDLVKYSLPLVPDSVGTTIVGMADRIVVKGVLGNSENGIYSIAHKFPSMIEVIYHFFMTAWNESASRVYESSKENQEKIKEYYQELYKFTQRFIIGAVLGLLAVMPLLFKVLIKGDYIRAFEYIPILLIAQLLNCIANFYSGILIANKDTRKIAKSTLIAAGINVILNISLVFFLGMYGVLIGTLISNIVLVLIRKNNSDKYIKLDENYKYLLITICVFVIILLLYDYNNIYKCIVAIIISIIYFFVTNNMFILMVFQWIKRKVSKKKEEKV